ncbi:hypothetical protein ACFX19_034354 [Malus domestica]
MECCSGRVVATTLPTSIIRNTSVISFPSLRIWLEKQQTSKCLGESRGEVMRLCQLLNHLGGDSPLETSMLLECFGVEERR